MLLQWLRADGGPKEALTSNVYMNVPASSRVDHVMLGPSWLTRWFTSTLLLGNRSRDTCQPRAAVAVPALLLLSL
ncbi:hypothetical protein MTO96_016688 [Rhipicephalus appendiculatus]